MRNILAFSFFLLMASYPLYGQKQECNEIPYIEVTGSADIEIEPDEIRLTVILGENENKEKERSLSLPEAEKIFADILAKNGIGEDRIILKNIGTGYHSYSYTRSSRDDDNYLRKEYDIILSNQSELENLLSAFPGPKQGFVYVGISELKHKDIIQYRKQTKIEAMKAAKAKAEYLLESVGASVGKLVRVIEYDSDDYGWNRHSNALSQVSSNAGGDSDNSGMKKIKLRYRMNVRFEIK